jgi:hypothetical protein
MKKDLMPEKISGSEFIYNIKNWDFDFFNYNVR